MKSRPKKSARSINPATKVFLKQVGWGLLLLGLIAALVYGIWHVTRLPGLTIKDLTVSEGMTIANTEIITTVEAKLAGTYLGLIPRRFAYFYPQSEIQTAILDKERIKSVVVERVGLTGLSIKYEEYIPHALWCSTTNRDDCWFIDKYGYAYTRAPKLTGGSFVRYHTLHREPASGETLTTPEDFLAIQDLRQRIIETNWHVEAVEIDAVRDVFYTLVGGSEIKVTLTAPIESTFDNLLTVRNSEEFSHLQPGHFMYLDLRFANRVFVKEEAVEAVEATLETMSTTSVVSEVSEEILPE